MTPKTESPLSALCKKHFPGKRFRTNYLKDAGKILKKHGEDAVVAFLSDKQEDEPANFCPPAKVHILAQSRPFEDWPINLASKAIQTYVYGLTADERKTCEPGTSKESHDRWFKETGVDHHGFTSVQGLNLIFKHTLNRYDGVIKKVETRNEKRRSSVVRINEKKAAEGLPLIAAEAEETAFGEDGRLLQPPGVNHSIYCFQQVSPQPYSSKKHPQVVLPHAVQGVDPDAPIPVGRPNRLDIPKGQPGYVPEWQRPHLSMKCKRVRMWYARANWRRKPGRRSVLNEARLKEASAKGALPIVLVIGDDWLVMDARGLLRSVFWRRVAKPGLSLSELLNVTPTGLFSGDPVIDPKRGLVTFTSKLGVVAVHSRKPTRGKKSKDLLLKMTKPTDDGMPRHVGMVAIDLGQTNPVAAEYSRVVQSDAGTLKQEPVSRGVLPDDLLKDVARYRRAYDLTEESIRQEAIALLSEGHRAEVTKLDQTTANETKRLLVDRGVSESLPWEKMSSNTTYISDCLVALGKTDDVFFVPKAKKGKKETGIAVKRKDHGWSKLLRPRTSPEARKALNENQWAVKRASPEYERLSRRKLELGRRCVNHIIQETKRWTQCEDIVVVLEDLNVGFFHGSGKRPDGWDNFFVSKRENRWFIQVLHKAFGDLATHRGTHVIEVHPARTSITCIKCGHCDAGNRDGESFVCLASACGDRRHADLEVATRNVARVAITGERMPPSEQARDVQKAGGARKRKPSARNVKSSYPAVEPAPASP